MACIALHNSNWETISIKDDIGKSRPKNHFSKKCPVASDRPNTRCMYDTSKRSSWCPLQILHSHREMTVGHIARKKIVPLHRSLPITKPPSNRIKIERHLCKILCPNDLYNCRAMNLNFTDNRSALHYFLCSYKNHSVNLSCTFYNVAVSCTWTLFLEIRRKACYPAYYGTSAWSWSFFI